MPASYWSGSALRTALLNVTDVQTILDEMVLQLTSTLPAAERWTSLGGGEYKSPLDSAGYSMRLKLTRQSATRLELLLKDYDGSTCRNGAIDITSGTNAWVMSGPRHWAIALSSVPSSRKVAFASILDPSPEPLSSHTLRLAWVIPLNTSGGDVTGGDTTGRMELRDYDATQYGYRVLQPVFAGTGGNFLYPNLARCSCAVAVCGRTSASSRRFYGYMNQFALVDRGDVDLTEVPVPVDTGVSGKFLVLPRQGLDFSPTKLAVRVPD